MEQRHHRGCVSFRGRVVGVAGAIGLLDSISPNTPNQKSIIIPVHRNSCQAKSCWHQRIRQSPWTSSHPIAKTSAPPPLRIESARRQIIIFLIYRFTPLLATCPQSTVVKPINAVDATMTAIIRSFVYLTTSSISFYLLFLQLYHFCGGLVRGSLKPLTFALSF